MNTKTAKNPVDLDMDKYIDFSAELATAQTEFILEIVGIAKKHNVDALEVYRMVGESIEKAVNDPLFADFILPLTVKGVKEG